MTVRMSSCKPLLARPAASEEDAALIAASMEGDADVVASLLASGAYPSCFSTTSYGVSPLVASATSGDQDVVRLLLRAQADPNYVTQTGNYALRAACLLGDGETICALLEGGADPNLETQRGTALSTACLQDDADTIKLLISHGADVNRITASGMTPLHTAVMNNKLDAARSLLQRGADPHAPHGHTHSCIELAEHLALPEMLCMLTQTAIGLSVDNALLASDQRRQVAVLAAEVAEADHACTSESRLQQLREHSSARVSELRSESSDLLLKYGALRERQRTERAAAFATLAGASSHMITNTTPPRTPSSLFMDRLIKSFAQPASGDFWPVAAQQWGYGGAEPVFEALVWDIGWGGCGACGASHSTQSRAAGIHSAHGISTSLSRHRLGNASTRKTRIASVDTLHLLADISFKEAIPIPEALAFIAAAAVAPILAPKMLNALKPAPCEECLGTGYTLCTVCKARGKVGGLTWNPVVSSYVGWADNCRECRARGAIACRPCRSTGLKNYWLWQPTADPGWGPRGNGPGA